MACRCWHQLHRDDERWCPNPSCTTFKRWCCATNDEKVAGCFLQSRDTQMFEDWEVSEVSMSVGRAPQPTLWKAFDRNWFWRLLPWCRWVFLAWVFLMAVLYEAGRNWLWYRRTAIGRPAQKKRRKRKRKKSKGIPGPRAWWMSLFRTLSLINALIYSLPIASLLYYWNGDRLVRNCRAILQNWDFESNHKFRKGMTIKNAARTIASSADSAYTSIGANRSLNTFISMQDIVLILSSYPWFTMCWILQILVLMTS